MNLKGKIAFVPGGTGGIGAEILANRLRVGPMHNCAECKFEEFFLSAWSVGDPAMIVDRPANVPCGPETTNPNNIGQDPNLPVFVDQLRDGTPCNPLPNAKATKAFFPDDPSNVYHGYINDHTKFRVLHAGTERHVEPQPAEHRGLRGHGPHVRPFAALRVSVARRRVTRRRRRVHR